MIFKRRLVREKVLQILYSYEMNKESLELTREELLAEINEKTDLEFANELLDNTITHLDELDAKIKGKVNNWELNRIALIDKILLRMGICEILFFTDIPPKVSINETIEVAKTFSTAGSSKFINGILDAVLSDLKKDGTLNKKGRGLIENNAILKNTK
jgi:transcription antitermination protein NusB